MTQVLDWPLDAPGMPLPGPNFVAEAEAIMARTPRNGNGDAASYLKDLYHRALYEAGFSLGILRGSGREPVIFVPGHLWDSKKDPASRLGLPPVAEGPSRADVMLLGKMPWTEEMRYLRNLMSGTGEVLRQLSDKFRVRHPERWYVTNLLKFKPPGNERTVKAAWKKDCLPLLHQELRIVRPKYILCLGADASTALLGPKAKVGYMEGRVVEYTFPVTRTGQDEPEHHTALVMTVLHPAEVSRDPTKMRILERYFSRFVALTEGARFDQVETDVDHRLITTYEEALDLVHEINSCMFGWQKSAKLIGWDAEWQGQHPLNKGSYLRTIQIAWAAKHAACFKISHPGGKLSFRDKNGKPALKCLAWLLNDFMKDKRAVFHFGNSDLEWLNYYGINPIANCPVSLEGRDGKQAWELLRDGEGWLDTSAIVHAIEETAALGLESVAMRYTNCPRYDLPLEDWKKEYCKAQGIKPSTLDGYGECPDDIIVSYSCYDAEAPLRALDSLLPLLDYDYDGNCAWEPCWETMITYPVILDMHKNGICVDRKRVDQLTKAFITGRASVEQKIRHWARWDDFNIRSTQHVREFLFGHELNGRRDKTSRLPVRIRPEEARSLHVEPLLDTSKPPRRWSDLKRSGEHVDASPTTGKQVLSILAQDYPDFTDQISWVRDFRFLDQALKSLLRTPLESDSEEGGWLEDDEGNLEYGGGIVACLDRDGRVRTHLYPTVETGRWRSSRPPLHNCAKQRDADYERLLGEQYRNKMRSMFVASKGFALCEFDIQGAELYMTALMCGSKLMREHCERGMLPEDDPNYYDIHSNIAVNVFRLPCPPTKKGLKSIGRIQMRTLAKNVIFGLLYGRGAKAIAMQAKENGINVTTEEVDQIIAGIFEMYQELQPFFEAAYNRTIDPRWLCQCFGRYRRFPTNKDDYKLEGELGRQGMNFYIQSPVASAVDRGLAWLHRYVYELGLQKDVRFLLQMHDAGLVEMRPHLIEYMCDPKDGLIKKCVCDMVPIYPTDLAGFPTGEGPFHFGIDIAVGLRWGEEPTIEECRAHGIPERFAT
jgi:DNA polymerase